MALTLSVELSDIDPEKNLAAYGIDSLMAVELRNWLGKDFAANLTVFEIMRATKIDDMAKLVVEKAQVGKRCWLIKLTSASDSGLPWVLMLIVSFSRRQVHDPCYVR